MKRGLFILVVASLVLLFTALLIPAGCAGVALPQQLTVSIDGRSGGSADIIARAFYHSFEKYWEGSIVLENRPGPPSRNYVYEKPADGSYLVQNGQMVVIFDRLYTTSMVYQKPTLKAFIPVACYLDGSGAGIVTPKDSPIKTLDQLIAAAKAKPGTVTLGIPGFGKTEHIVAVLLERAVGIKFRMVPYEGSGDVIAAVMGKHIDAGIVAPEVPAARPESVNILANSVAKRADPWLGVPTFTELGYPQIEVAARFGAFVKEGTPQGIISKMEKAMKKAFYDETYQQWSKKTETTIGDFFDQKAFTDIMVNYDKEIESIFPIIKASMEEVAK